MEIAFDKHDKMSLGPNGVTISQRIRSILSDIFKLQRSMIMSAITMEMG
jgi:hypothetical protein